MTNYEAILKYGAEDKEGTINELSEILAKVCAIAIRRLNAEQDEHIEISNLELHDIENDFKQFFNHEAKVQD